jgi:glutamate synthase (NADPH) large chain
MVTVRPYASAPDLLSPAYHKSSCGFGLIAHTQGVPSRWVVDAGISALCRLTHRGAVAADGKSGDGCGLLLALPDAFLRQAARQAGITLPGLYAVGQLFVSPDEAVGQGSVHAVCQSLEAEGFTIAGYRHVPVDPTACGDKAKSCLPHVVQLFVHQPDGMDTPTFERRLFVARLRAEHQRQTEDADFYIASLSSQTVVYKGMVTPDNLPRFYPDLQHPAFMSALCLFHQRFSTNTWPRWALAQPFRYLGHNGEINTINANRQWSFTRRNRLISRLIPELPDLHPLVSLAGSDSQSLDNLLEVMTLGGMGLLKAIRLLIPPAWQKHTSMDPDIRAFYDFYSQFVEPWDGPAGLVLTDGRQAVCALDRNGLRPVRWQMTADGHLIIASETGVLDIPGEHITQKGILSPGQVLALDMTTGQLRLTDEVDRQLAQEHPYWPWMDANIIRLDQRNQQDWVETDTPALSGPNLLKAKKVMGYTYERINQVLWPMAADSQEATGSMGDDTPMAVLSSQNRSLYDYFRQLFAQVTNPPIDPIRENRVMSLKTCFGPESNPFEPTPQAARRIEVPSPILSPGQFALLSGMTEAHFTPHCLRLTCLPQETLEHALHRLADEAIQAVQRGAVMLILSDRELNHGGIPVHALLATGAIHHALIEAGLRCEANLLVETGTVMDAHQLAVLIGYGATAVYPYLAYASLLDLAQKKVVPTDGLLGQYRAALEKGLYKIMSKMGISTVNSYRGAQLFEAVGLHQNVIATCFTGTLSRLQGLTFANLDTLQRTLWKHAVDDAHPLPMGGLLKFNPDGETHAFEPAVVMALQKAVQTGDWADYQAYATLVDQRNPLALRDLLGVTLAERPVPLAAVEPAEALFKRFDCAAMSLGSISPEAHEAIALAMNRLGARSNSGEGGEDPARFGSERVSRIKQVASARFGVTPAYLMSAEVLQIKVAQGAKPGEGGQLPGFKVNGLIAQLRYTVPNTPLISPPPHHDIYSIEDLAQLIFDLKQVNPQALVSVKLVSEPGVGTVAAGVAKTYADWITIAGYDGGTGASPLSSIKHAGLPWELGLSEAHQVLRANGLRGRVRLQADGGLKTGLDVIKAAILGAELFTFGTAPLVALGCKYLRICHLNTCATGIATQNDVLRQHHFQGTPERVENFFRFVAEDVRQWLARLGMTRLDEVIGRVDLLHQLPGTTPQHRQLDLGVLLSHRPSDQPQFCQQPTNPPHDVGELAQQVLRDVSPAIAQQTGGQFHYTINNTHRSMGAAVSGAIAARYGDQGMAHQPIHLHFTGVAGQSFGVWNAGGLHLTLTGDANDYVGKGMAGGHIVLIPPTYSQVDMVPDRVSNTAQGLKHTFGGCVPEHRSNALDDLYGNQLYTQPSWPIMGNGCLFGATGGHLYAAGQAGQRFAVRNSGATAVLEGLGDHGCEYMTGGTVVVLGAIGYNFAAGMTGGVAYVLNMAEDMSDKLNTELVNRYNLTDLPEDEARVHALVTRFVAETRSTWGQTVLDNWDAYLPTWAVVLPKTTDRPVTPQIKQAMAIPVGKG